MSSFRCSKIIFSWVKLPTTNFRTVLTKNLRNRRDVAPLLITYELAKLGIFVGTFVGDSFSEPLEIVINSLPASFALKYILNAQAKY